jgi:hypothetical protein
MAMKAAAKMKIAEMAKNIGEEMKTENRIGGTWQQQNMKYGSINGEM